MTNITNITQLRTPYHALGDADGPRVPEWARNRSVYRSAGRTLYLVETDRVEAAAHDLKTLTERGWDVSVDRSGDAANIMLTRAAA